MSKQIFRQLFDANSSTYTYLLADPCTKTAFLIDAVKEQVSRDLQLVKELGIEHLLLISTHIHADHITGNAQIKRQFPSAKSFISKYYKDAGLAAVRADEFIDESSTLSTAAASEEKQCDVDNNASGDQICSSSSTVLEFLHTPGHTCGCLSIVDHRHRRVFTGDALLVRGCGRVDFQGGSASALYESVTKKLFSLPRDYSVYPAHDYTGRTASSIGEEIDFNSRLGKSRPLNEFVDIMSKLNLPRPKLIDVAVPANVNCGFCSGDEDDN